MTPSSPQSVQCRIHAQMVDILQGANNHIDVLVTLFDPFPVAPIKITDDLDGDLA